jgi:uncharacterized delta-60 repeat protein
VAILKNRTVIIGAALVGAVLIGVLIWNWDRPSTSGLPPAASGETPNASLSLLSPGILGVALGSGNTGAQGLALRGDGTIVVGGTFSSAPAPGLSNSRGFVLRMTSNGRLANPAVTLIADTPASVSGLSTARDGTIVVYGSSAVPKGHFVLARLRPDGALDPAFGSGGAVLANMRSSMWLGDTAHAVAIQGDGKIVATGVAGYAAGPLAQGSYCVTARFSQDGRFDRSFGDSGRLLTLVAGKQYCTASSVLVAPDEKIIVVGHYRAEHEPPHIALFRYLPDGTPDRQFGRDGIAQLLQISASVWGGAVFDSQGRIVVVGSEWVSPSSARFLVVRFDPNGNLDRSFGADGIVSLAGGTVSQELVAAALQQDGKIVAVGRSGWHGGTRAAEPGKRDEIVVTRLDANGALDGSFAGGGLLLMASPRYLWGGRAIAIQPDGKLLIAGDFVDDANDRATSAIVLLRLNPDGTPDADFGSGVDTP